MHGAWAKGDLERNRAGAKCYGRDRNEGIRIMKIFLALYFFSVILTYNLTGTTYD